MSIRFEVPGAEYKAFHNVLSFVWATLKRGGRLYDGLCYQIIYAPAIEGGPAPALSFLRVLMRRWPHHSGDATYPVPASPDKVFYPCPFKAFITATRAERWSISNYYGAMRLDLLVFLILEVEEFLTRNNIPFTPIGGSSHG